MKLWNIFDWFVSTDNGEIVNKIDDLTYLRSDGTVYREQDNLITGSDGSVMTLLDTGGATQSGSPRMAIRTYSGRDPDADC